MRVDQPRDNGRPLQRHHQRAWPRRRAHPFGRPDRRDPLIPDQHRPGRLAPAAIETMSASVSSTSTVSPSGDLRPGQTGCNAAQRSGHQRKLQRTEGSAEQNGPSTRRASTALTSYSACITMLCAARNRAAWTLRRAQSRQFWIMHRRRRASSRHVRKIGRRGTSRACLFPGGRRVGRRWSTCGRCVFIPRIARGGYWTSSRAGELWWRR